MAAKQERPTGARIPHPASLVAPSERPKHFIQKASPTSIQNQEHRQEGAPRSIAAACTCTSAPVAFLNTVSCFPTGHGAVERSCYFGRMTSKDSTPVDTKSAPNDTKRLQVSLSFCRSPTCLVRSKNSLKREPEPPSFVCTSQSPSRSCHTCLH